MPLKTVSYCTGEESDCCEGEPGQVCPGCGKLVPPSMTHAITADEVRELTTPEKVADKLLLEERAVRQPKGFAAKLKAGLHREQQSSREGPPHIIVKALAGTGKTTTLIGALQSLKGLTPTTVIRDEQGKKITVPIEPSPQQRAIWDAIAESLGHARFVAFVAFNKSIATELADRVPQGMDAMTMHQMGYKAVNKAFGYCRLETKRVPKIIEELLEQDWFSLQRGPKAEMVAAAVELTRLVKLNLVPLDVEEESDKEAVARNLQDLVDYYDVEVNGNKEELFDLVPRIIERCREVRKDRTVDFDDMIWLPVALGLPLFQYDLLLIDEAQDLSRCQQALCKMAGKRLVFCGDENQSLYGFAGADFGGMRRLAKELGNTPRGCVELPLTMTRRCGKAIVERAKQYVPEFEAHPSNPEGAVLHAIFQTPEGTRPYRELVNGGDHVICRVNAPLIGECLGFLAEGRKASVLGRDVAAGLKATLKRIKAPTVPEMVERLDSWLSAEVAKEQSKKFPSEGRIISLQDRADCLHVFLRDSTSYEEVVSRIDRVFTGNPDEPGIRLSSVHRAKGLEARRVFFLQPKGTGGAPAKTPWQQEAERCIAYVGCTRAIEELYYVV